jgi:glycosyltransferase involved in cell wall biosynthesis
MPRILLITHDVVGTRMAGPGIRAWELARALATEHTVTLASPRLADALPPGVAGHSYTWANHTTLAPALAACDLVVANGHVLEGHPELAGIPQPLVLDLYDPTALEHLELLRSASLTERQDRYAGDVALLRRQLQAGDMFLCATERQRDLYLGGLLLAGRTTPTLADADPELRGLLRVVPFGLPPDPPPPAAPALRGVIPGIGSQDTLLLWSGGLWDWMDPLTLLRAVAILGRPDLRLVFLAGAHPGPARPPAMPARARELAATLGLLGNSVFFYEEWVPYQRRGDFLQEADLLVSLHRRHLESAYAAVRSRFLDHLWAGRPSLLTAGDAAAALVEQHHLGRTAPPDDAAAVAAALAALLSDPNELRACGQRAKDLAASFTWENVAAPLLSYCRAPVRTAARMPLLPATATTSDPAATPLGRLDGLWQVTPQPLASNMPLLGQAKELANSLARWYVQGIVAQQNQFNATVVQALQGLSARIDSLDDRARWEGRAVWQSLADVQAALATLNDADSALAERLATFTDPVDE